MKAQGAENVNIKNLNLNLNINIGDTNVNVKPELNPNTNVNALSKILDRLTPKEPPKLSGFEPPPSEDIKWITDNLTTAVNSSAFTLSTMASTEIEIETGKADYYKRKDEKG